MTKQRKPSQPSQGDGPSRFAGADQHGWSPDVDETKQQDNRSAHRSFHPHGRPSQSRGKRGEDQKKGSGDEGMHDLGPKGRSRRPSGTKDASATTGVDPQDPPGTRSAG
ncbi:hypothetical protein ACFYYM_40085 [Streptomyces erythrochromogenes]|uniref:hypothetical protein n=1 Tax=Streptomyces erythrochromogenes TaxID=285574 RepID=UPI0036CD47D6